MAPPTCPADTYVQNLRTGAFRIGVVGMGYVGLPLALEFARRVSVVGFDTDAERIATLQSGQSPLPHIDASAVQARVGTRMHPTDDPRRLATCDAIVVCVPTPLGPHREPDLSHVRAAADLVGQHMRPGCLVVLESTTYPGTTEEVFGPLISRNSGLTPGLEWWLAYSPEREDPGSRRPTRSVPKVVGGHDETARNLAWLTYGLAFDRVVTVTNCRTAEMTKLLENIYRCVNIALVNELKVLCHRMGNLDIHEVIDAAATKPFGFQPFYPGPGLGGHCIPIDPFYLTWKAHEVGVPTRFIELAGEVNQAMPEYVVGRLTEALNDIYKSMAGARVLVVGVAYKKNVSDMREAPSLRIIDRIDKLGAQVAYYDPWVEQLLLPTACGQRRRIRRVTTLDALATFDAVLILTDHDAGIDWHHIAAHPLIVDTRNTLVRHGTGRAPVPA